MINELGQYWYDKTEGVRHDSVITVTKSIRAETFKEGTMTK